MTTCEIFCTMPDSYRDLVRSRIQPTPEGCDCTAHTEIACHTPGKAAKNEDLGPDWMVPILFFAVLFFAAGLIYLRNNLIR